MKETFPILPAGSGSLWFLAVVAVILLVAAAFLAAVAVSTRSGRVELTDAGIAIHSAFYGRTIPWSSVFADRAMPLDLTRSPEHEPSIRTNGIGLPGYNAGWFRLRNGSNALAFITDRHSVACVPTRDFVLLVSLGEPVSFVEAVKKRTHRS